MIDTVIFDFGQVLVHFDPPTMVGTYITDADDRTLVTEVLFDRLYWDALDAGTISDEEMLSAVHTRLPERLWDTADTIYRHWVDMLPEIDGMDALLCELKAAKVPLYLLSNISTYFAKHRDAVPILSHFDGCVFSAVCKLTKPHAAVFEYLCNTYGCDPTRTLFVDDSAVNIAGAQAFGLHTYHFDGDAAALRRFLQEQHLL